MGRTLLKYSPFQSLLGQQVQLALLGLTEMTGQQDQRGRLDQRGLLALLAQMAQMVRLDPLVLPDLPHLRLLTEVYQLQATTFHPIPTQVFTESEQTTWVSQQVEY